MGRALAPTAHRLAEIRRLAALGCDAHAIARQLGTDAWVIDRTAMAHGINVKYERRTKANPPRPKREALPVLLEPDTRPNRPDGRPQIERRRWNCARLGNCELAWVEAHGPAQARCPELCLAFRPGPGDHGSVA